MKPDDTPEPLKTNLQDGVAQDSKTTRRFQQMPGAGRPKSNRRKKLRSESKQSSRVRKEQQRIIKIRSIVIFGITILVLGFFLVLWMLPHIKPPEVYTAKSNSLTKAEVKTKEITHFPAPTSKEALAFVEKAMAVREPDKIAQYFRPDGPNPQEIVDYLKGMDARDGLMGDLQWLSNIGTTAIPLEGVVVKFKGQGKPTNRLALLTPDATGKWRIDFDAFARTVTPSWTDLLEKQAPVGVVRVFVKKDFYYNGPFLNEKEWICYSIGSIDSKKNLSAYCRIGSPQAAAINWMLSKEAKITRATLEIRRVKGAESSQFEISRVIAEDWVLSTTPFDEGFK
jgi:hypothetical protein